MPKRVGNIYARMEAPDFIRRCIAIGTRDSKKRRRRDVRRVLADLDGHVATMQRIVRERSFCPRQPNQRTIYDVSSQKNRDTNSVPFFPDALMHILEVQAMMDVLMRGMCHWSCSSVPGRGGRRVYLRLKSAMKNDPKGTRYAAELDVKSYYPSLPLDRLMEAFERKIKDREFLLLLALSLTCRPISLQEAKDQGLTWRDITQGRRGLFIGFYLCQWAANYYLEPLDRFIMTLPGVKYMTRHMDNITLLGPSKRDLHKAVNAIRDFMGRELGLTMKENWQVYRTSFTAAVEKRHRLLTERQRRLRRPRMVSAVGYRFAHTHVTIRKRNFLRLTRQARRTKKRIEAKKPISPRLAAGLLSRIGQLKHSNSYNVRTKYIDPIGVKVLKEVVRNESARKCCSQQRLYSGGAA